MKSPKIRWDEIMAVMGTGIFHLLSCLWKIKGVFIPGAVLFSLVHIPDWRLMIGTLGMGLLFVPLYLRYGNLWPLGFYHGWLGSIFYLWVLGQDPWKQILLQIR